MLGSSRRPIIHQYIRKFVVMVDCFGPSGTRADKLKVVVLL